VGCAAFAASCVLAVGVAQAWADPPTPVAAGPDASPPPAAAAPARSVEGQVRSAPDRGPFAALWVVPFATYHFQGAGADGLYRVGFLQNGYAPVSGSPLLTLQRTQRFLLDVEVDARWRFNKMGTLSAGGGVGVVNDWVDTTSMSGLTWNTATDQQWRLRPLIGVTLARRSRRGGSVASPPSVR